MEETSRKFSKIVNKGQVYLKTNISQRPLVAKKDRKFEVEVEIIADYPHENDDFSYLCGSEFCRCLQ